MKIAISSDGDSLDANIDQRFGRCRYFLIVETKDNKIKSFKAVGNEGTAEGHGAGIRASRQLGELGVDAVITGALGPNSTDVLKELGIKTYHASGKAKDAIRKFNNNELEEINQVSTPHTETKKENSVTKTERIFFPLLENKGKDSKISTHFGHAPFFGLYDVSNGELEIIENNLDHTDPAKSPIDQIQEKVNPTTIFAHDIGGRAINIIKEKGLHLKTGKYKTIKDVLENLDKLEDLTDGCGHEED